MDSIITATYRLIIRGGSPNQLLLDEDFMKLLDVTDNSDPEDNYVRWHECVHPDDIPLLREAIDSTIRGIKAEVKYRWNHRTKGLYTVYSSGMLASKENGRAVIYGYFKGIPADRTQLFRYDPDLQLLTRLFTEKLLDSFALCALTDVSSNKMLILNDAFGTSAAAGTECEYGKWVSSLIGKIHPDDRTRLSQLIDADSLQNSFGSTDEVHGEFRIQYNGNYYWVNLRFVKMKQRLAAKYPQFIVMRRIVADHRAVFMEELRNQLINRLALPYQIIDLINLKDGSYYSSDDKQSSYAEHFSEIGIFNEAMHQFADNCECSQSDRNAILYNLDMENMKKRFAAGEKMIEIEICQRHGDETEWIRIQSFMSDTDENGEPSMAILTIQPITAEKLRELRYQQRLERALRSESQYRQAILSNAIAVYTYNITRDTIYDEVIEQEGVDPILPLLGLEIPCSYNEYISRKADLFTDKSAADVFRRTFCTETLCDMYDSHRRSFDTEYELAVNGRIGFFREAVILTQDIETGDLWGLTYVRNITDEHNRSVQVEQALRDAFTQAQHANSAKTLFMSQMSHDIRTPLNSILGMSAIAQEHIGDPARVNDCLDKIQTSGRHLLEIINNVLDLSAIESGKTTLAMEPFDLKIFLDETISIIKPIADAKHHKLIVSIDSGMNFNVAGDKAKLRQLLTNILSNAVKYTPDGGEIRFSTIELSPDHSGIHRYLFTVQDNGIGMKPEFKEHIFDPFVRADDFRISGIQGTGLGMPIALNIARMMNGDIGISSAIGKGSRFEITICLKEGARVDAKPADAPAKSKRIRMSDFDFGGTRVLLAEDLEFNAEIASEFFAEANIVTDIAHNGAEAVEMFRNSAAGYYSMVFMDIQMPVLDGYGASDKIRALPREDAASVPIIAMTANAFIEDIKKSKEHGMNGHVSKPLEIPALTRELCKWLKNQKNAE